MCLAHTPPPAPPAPPPRFEFDCFVCERTEFGASPDLPEGWAEILIEAEKHALCRDCAGWAEKDR